ncbi:uncharacterized protein EURHEDRAFT_514071 [Aspergillus ruber CBS 135680]|uniref:Amino acid transporter transmembrane domain-containing protein n=1 Tax=Aspergillus ruber (strain CBS 135680) TaxID=1388766 RepID=A0A017SIP5_ASPRC|nr:uncharacterized protein EURHEDRAFT_514071 [Aspergillus ruber CBS 135680]EYE96828.1 hypothetical protein EURHEDRAFT_514071 [Aspergillus ruber CBS 135680]
MMKIEVGIGVLSLPQVFDTLGMIPGVLALLAISSITTWSAYIVGCFKLNHPDMYTIADVVWIFIAGSGILGLSIGLNAVSMHATCTAAFVAVATVIGWIFTSVQTLGKMSWVAWAGMGSVLGAAFTLTIAVGVQGRPANVALSQVDPTTEWQLWGDLVYYYCGSNVASLVLSSAGALMKRVCYGLALPGLIVSTVLNAHLTSKYIFICRLQGTKHLTTNTWTHWITWLGCTSTIIVIAYCIASGIPEFSALVSLISAVFGTFMSFHPMGCMWLYDNWTKEQTTWWYFMVSWSCFVLVAGTFLMISGSYGSVVALIDIFNGDDTSSSAWSCDDNSNSV